VEGTKGAAFPNSHKNGPSDNTNSPRATGPQLTRAATAPVRYWAWHLPRARQEGGRTTSRNPASSRIASKLREQIALHLGRRAGNFLGLGEGDCCEGLKPCHRLARLSSLSSPPARVRSYPKLVQTTTKAWGGSQGPAIQIVCSSSSLLFLRSRTSVSFMRLKFLRRKFRVAETRDGLASLVSRGQSPSQVLTFRSGAQISIRVWFRGPQVVASVFSISVLVENCANFSTGPEPPTGRLAVGLALGDSHSTKMKTGPADRCLGANFRTSFWHWRRELSGPG